MAWAYLQAAQALPTLIGPPLSSYLSLKLGGRAGYTFSAICLLAASATLFFISLHKRRLQRKSRKKARQKDEQDEEVENRVEEPKMIRSSFTYDEHFPPPHFLQSQSSLDDILDFKKPDMTCISEEGIADMDLPDNLLDELEFLDNITSCNNMENYLMLSEYEQNLIKETESPVGLLGEGVGRKGKRWSLGRQGSSFMHLGLERRRSLIRPGDLGGRGGVNGHRVITTIDEASV